MVAKRGHPQADSALSMGHKKELGEHLAKGESLLWSGQPRQGVMLRWSDAFLIPITLAWSGVMLVFEAGQSACSILLPYAIKQIMDAVGNAHALGTAVWEEVQGPLWLFAGLNLGIVLFARASGTLLVVLGPELRRRIRRELFVYLQHHSQRYFLSNFAGSLANRIAEVSMSVAHTLWTVLFDFWPMTIAFGIVFD